MWEPIKSAAPLAALTTAALASTLTGCATKTYVNERIDAATRASDAKIGEVQRQVEGNGRAVAALQAADESQSRQIAELSDTAREALARAQEAGKLAQGTFLWETTLTDDSVRFSFSSSALSPEARTALDAIAERLKADNRNVYLEMQGHTDSSGPESYNLALGEQRAQAVRRYLNVHNGIPLHRMNVISYGESRPVADNATREGRAANRRVTIVVLG